MQKLLLKLSPLFFFLLIFSCAKDNEITPTEATTEILQAREGAGKPCTIPCKTPEDIRVDNISACTAEIVWATGGNFCGTFIVQVQNQTTGNWTYHNAAVSPFMLTGLDPCTDYLVGVSHVTDICASAPLTLNFQTTCGPCKPCNGPCKTPEVSYVTDITATSATAHFYFNQPTCGYFVAQLKNQTTGAYTYFNPAVSPLSLSGLNPCTIYTIYISHVTDICASVPVPITFTTECPEPCEASGGDASCMFNQYILNYSEIMTYDPSTGYVDATDQSIDLIPGEVFPMTATGNCFCLNLGGDAYMSLWIDANQNNIFEASELMYSHSIPLSSGSNPAISCLDIPMPGFTVPNVEACGLLARYIISHDPIVGPCASFTTGQVVDFLINTMECGG